MSRDGEEQDKTHYMKFDLLRRKPTEMFDTFTYITWCANGICSDSNKTSEIDHAR
jgi:hypothetical protein